MNTALQLIKGVVADLVIQRGEEVFVQNNIERTAGGGVAAMLVAAGMAGSATGALLASTGAADSVEFFACTVEGKQLAGRFSKVTFKEGDAVEAVAEAQSDGTYAALAVRRPSDQTLWMFPHCSRGEKKHLAYACRAILWIFVSLVFLLFSFFGNLHFFSKGEIPRSFIFMELLVGGTFALLAAFHFSIKGARRWRPFVIKAEAIFTALGYTDPSRVDMGQQHKKYLKQHGGTWPYLQDGPWVYRYADTR